MLAVSTSAILIRWSDAPPVVAAFYRVLFTTALVAPVALGRHADRLSALSGRDLLAAALTGVALSVHFAAWFESLSWTSVAASVTLVQSHPLFVAVGAWLVLDERVDGRTAVGVVVAVAGMAVMSLGDLLGGGVGAAPLYGNALAAVGGLMTAGYLLAGRSLRQRLPLFPYVAVVYGVAAACLLGFAVASGAPVRGYPAHEWLLFLAMAVGPGVFGHTVLNWALEHVESSLVSVSLLGEPLGSALLALVILSEVPSAATLLGGTVVLVGVAATARARSSGD
ncbi:DMT family transporter [Halomicroarcula sp. GCM10025709]|uniref:DMT family transporter n=1 Tax=Halomicroarcula sp. GCM10025709 TaxID=3252669 RepID=UPI00361CA175